MLQLSHTKLAHTPNSPSWSFWRGWFHTPNSSTHQTRPAPKEPAKFHTKLGRRRRRWKFVITVSQYTGTFASKIPETKPHTKLARFGFWKLRPGYALRKHDHLFLAVHQLKNSTVSKVHQFINSSSSTVSKVHQFINSSNSTPSIFINSSTFHRKSSSIHQIAQ